MLALFAAFTWYPVKWSSAACIAHHALDIPLHVTCVVSDWLPHFALIL